ncbi:hypothetical protein BH11PLA2_BH11PLA2_49880 [soil metagenome]
MGSFFTKVTCRLAAGKDTKYDYRFGGRPHHRGLVPPGRNKPVTLLYDLDLRDPKHGLSEFFPGLTRLPLLAALQYNGTGLLYRVTSDNTVELQPLEDENTVWNKDFPFVDFPLYLPESPICLKPLRILNRFRYSTPAIGEKVVLDQGFPEWRCPNSKKGCSLSCDSKRKQVFATIWEMPLDTFHIWDKDLNSYLREEVIITFSRCTSCGILHSAHQCS